jgi:hypothetical protein
LLMALCTSSLEADTPRKLYFMSLMIKKESRSFAGFKFTRIKAINTLASADLVPEYLLL